MAKRTELLVDFDNEILLIKPNEDAQCVCCLAKNVKFISLSKCSHIMFLEIFLKIKMEYINELVCYQCHGMLKKFDLFKQQVEQSYMILNKQINHILDYKVLKLERTATETYNMPSSEVVLKPDSPPPEAAILEPLTDIKVEYDSSEIDNDVSMPQTKNATGKNKAVRKCQTLKKEYKGKIKLVTLSREELTEEREREKRSERYLKLPYKCESCISGFDHENTLKSHNDTRHAMKDSSYQCDICNSILGTIDSYRGHRRRHFKRFECVICGKRSVQLYSLAQHFNQVHGDRADIILMQFSCERCHFTTDSHRAYKYHLDKHKQRPECNVCGKAFVNTDGLRKHMYGVHKQSRREYACDACAKSYACKSGLHAHVAAAHRAGEASYCGTCRTHYRTRRGLDHHLNTHSAHVAHRFICDDCGAKFLSKSSLRIHIEWEHLKTIRHVCPKCSKAFKTGSSMRKHLSFVHEKKRPPRDKICDYCGRGFTTRAILANHVRTHTGERPWRCTHCAASFAHSAALYTHGRLLHS